MTTTTLPLLPTRGRTARFELDNGDSYIGEFVKDSGDLVTIRNYAVWYDGASAPFNSKHYDDEVRFRIDSKTHIEQF